MQVYMQTRTYPFELTQELSLVFKPLGSRWNTRCSHAARLGRNQLDTMKSNDKQTAIYTHNNIDIYYKKKILTNEIHKNNNIVTCV